MKYYIIRITATLLYLIVASVTEAQIDASAPGADRQPVQAETASAQFWDKSREGWWWYIDPRIEKEKEQSKDITKQLSEIKNIEDLRKEVERLRNAAIMEPTRGNIETYLYAQKFIMDKSTVFADSWRRVVWQTPDLDYSLVRPTNSNGIMRFNEERGKNEKNYIVEMAQQGYGIFFFYSSTCPFCHEMAPVLRLFESMYGMRVLAISVDGGPIEGFPDAKQDNGASKRLGVETMPALYLVSSREKNVMPIGFGMLSISEIVDRINVLMNTTPGTAY